MDDYHVRLVLEYFLARSTRERTLATLTGIVQHIASTYALGPAMTQALQNNATMVAQRRGLLRSADAGPCA